MNFEGLRNAAYKASEAQAATRQRGDRETYGVRSATVKDYVFLRANGVCEGCQYPAPLARANGTPYLEPHHLLRVACDGADDPAYVAAVCPSCHRRCHYGADGDDYNEALLQRIKKLGIHVKTR